MSGFDKSEYDDNTINLGGLNTAAADFVSIIGDMTGHSGDVKQTLTSGANNFTDMISESIKSEAAYDADLWAKASMFCVVGSGITELWIQNIKDFRDKLDELQQEWDDYPPPPKDDKSSSSEGKNSDALDAYKTAKLEKLQELKDRAEAARSKFEDEASERNSDLKKGADDFPVKKLVDAGVLGWAAYNILGPGQPVPITTNGEIGKLHARRAAKALKDGKNVPPEILAALAYLNQVGLDNLGTEERLNKDQRDYLQNFFDSLEGQFEVQGLYAGFEPLGILAVPDILSGNAGVPVPDREEALAILGGGLLTLSNEDLGGGLELLPESVQRVVNGPESYPFDYHNSDYRQHSEWGADLRKLGLLLGPVEKDIQGGKEFSAGLTTSIGNELDKHGHLTYPGHNLDYSNDKVLQPILDVSTRNEKANYEILTGQYEHSHYPSDPTNILRGLYRYQWDDDGQAVRGLTDWISDASASNDAEERTRAGEATAALIKTLTQKDDVFSAFANTGVDLSSDGGSRSATFTEMNPEIADSLTDIFKSYTQDFGKSIDGNKTFKYGEEGLEIDSRARARFLQYLVADEASAIRTISLVEKNQFDSFDYYLERGDSKDGDDTVAGDSGRLKGLLEAAISNEMLNRYNNSEEAAEASVELKRKAWDFILDQASGEAISKVPGGKAGGKIAEFTVKEFVTDEVKKEVTKILDKQKEEMLNADLEKFKADNPENLEKVLKKNYDENQMVIGKYAVDRMVDRGVITDKYVQSLGVNDALREVQMAIPNANDEFDRGANRVEPGGSRAYAIEGDIASQNKDYYNHSLMTESKNFSDQNWNGYMQYAAEYSSTSPEAYKNFEAGTGPTGWPIDLQPQK
ncbi:hypothetical protein HNR23_004070 [Nocardiopsis mwathae]|uniref:TPR repeat domain-containing protein n=1 Tax=Nocardiopsis mwathae TaxID=1472723 RepID=A0A7W9YKS8_9ACTN|nr:hypothetical protein [Nocardiopsis mwathae]MBB6174010.1 hypothetical protein [Nocardiopsis mwathae]